MNRFSIKLIACLSMLIDHVCLVFFAKNTAANFLRHSVGRMAFPLFAFMLCQGFFYTRNRKQYCFNLLVSALISEVFFDLGLHHALLYAKKQNVIFTLLIALLLMMALERLGSNYLIQILLILAFCAAARFLRTDYGMYGVAVCVIFYYTRHLEPWQSCAFACIPLLIRYGSIGAYLAVLPLISYKKTGGRLPAPVKYAFYCFYPGHLALIYVVYRLIH